MSTFASRNNKGNKIFDFDTTDMLYVKAKELVIGRVYPCRGLFISSSGKFGNHPVIFSDDFLLDAPKSMLESCEDILSNIDDINDIKNGKVGFVREDYFSKNYGVECSTIRWIDIEPELPFT